MDYFWLTLKHKWYILVASQAIKISLWRALKHDVSKFSHIEYSGYQRHFFGDKNDPEGFAYAWLHHENHNSHHWGYWIPRSGKYTGEPLPMPENDTREMVADWLAAGRAYEESWDMSNWLSKNLSRIRVHPETKKQIIQILVDLGYHQARGWFKVVKVKI